MTHFQPDREFSTPDIKDQGNTSDISPYELLEQLEADVSETEFAFKRARKLKRVAAMFQEEGNSEQAQRTELKSALFDFMLVSRGGDRTQYGRFAPMMEWSGNAYPHVLAFPPGSMLIFKEELDRSGNPIHRALYADFIWDQRARYPGSKKDAYEAAKTAIDAYLKAAGHYRDNGWNDQLADALDRAAELALSIKDTARIARSKRECFTFAEGLLAQDLHPSVRWAIDVLETLQRFDSYLSQEDHGRIVSLAETGALFYEAVGNHHIEKSFLDLVAVSQRALGDNDKAHSALARSAHTYVTEADETTSAIVQLHFLQKAIEAYQQLGDPGTVDKLKQRLSQAGLDSLSEMKTVTATATISADMAEAWVNALLSLELKEALTVLSTARRFIPAIDDVRERAEKRRQETPMAYLVSRSTLDSAGRIVKTASSEVEQVVASEADVYNAEMAMGDWELGLAFERLQSEKGLTAETLMEFLQSNPIFEAATLNMVSIGAERYFAGDYASALHILVPQLEDTFRDILAKLDISRTSVQQGMAREKPLEIVLETVTLRAVLGEDTAEFFERFLIRPEGENLRNRTAHGLLKREHCTPAIAHRVILCYLLLANLTVDTASA